MVAICRVEPLLKACYAETVSTLPHSAIEVSDAGSVGDVLSIKWNVRKWAPHLLEANSTLHLLRDDVENYF